MKTLICVVASLLLTSCALLPEFSLALEQAEEVIAVVEGGKDATP